MKEQDARKVYADIIDLPHHQSNTRSHMSLYDRAAQFAPFAALVGFDEMITEEGRLTDRQIQLTEAEMDILNHKIGCIRTALERGEHPAVTLTYFLPDLRKEGGSYEKICGLVKKIDDTSKTFVLYGSEEIGDRCIPAMEIPIERVIEIGEGIESHYD